MNKRSGEHAARAARFEHICKFTISMQGFEGLQR